MDPLVLFKILSLFVLHCDKFAVAKPNDKVISQNKTYREVEPFTTIFLNNESFSIVSQAKYPIHKSNGRKEDFTRIGKMNHHRKANNGMLHNVYRNTAIKPHHATPSSPRDDIVDKNVKNLSKQHHDKLIKYLNDARPQKKIIHKRHFEKPIRYYYKNLNEIKRSDFGPTYRFVLTEATKAPKNNFDKHQTFLATARNFDEKSSTNEFFEDVNVNPWQNAEHLTTTVQSMKVRSYGPFPSSLAPTWLDSSYSKQDNFDNLPQNSRNSDNSLLHQHEAKNSYSNGYRPTIRSPLLLTTAPLLHTVTFHQADVVERNLAAATRKEKQEKNEKDKTPSDEFELDDAAITFDVTCDQTVSQTCTLQRELGAALTLAVKIKSSKKPESFQVRWMKLYHRFDSDKGKPLEIEPGKLPWNIVSGSEGRQLRLNPVTNSDMDPNCFIARVFLVSKKHGKVLFTELKKMVFRIEIPIIDMGKLYAGEELNINIENFISLPEKGNLLFQWNLETKPQVYEPLPSNIKVSHSGRSVVIKELKKGVLGVLNCVVYSANRYAVAKRRFNILKVAENLKRRSTAMTLADDPLLTDLERTRRCRHIIRRSQEKAKQRLIDGNKPKSRKKRFKRMESAESHSSEIDCEPLRKKMYSRWVRSLFQKITTEDPRLMPLEKLLELSEDGDGTLDDVIPHEVHYVSPEVKLVPGTSVERSVDRPISTNCTSHFDCGENAVCVFSEDETNSTARIGNCYCRPEFYRDRTTCRKIPSSNHREKRLKRNDRNDFAVPQHLFYENSREMAKSTPETLEEDEDTQPPKVLAFEEEESFLLTDCIDDRDCSMHANCIQPHNGHPYCKCRPGFRGNGVFCWEMMDYVPPSEQVFKDEEIDTLNESPLHPEIPVERMGVKGMEPQIIEE